MCSVIENKEKDYFKKDGLSQHANATESSSEMIWSCVGLF